MVLRGHVRNGVVVLDDPMQLPEGAEVHVQILPVSSRDEDLAGSEIEQAELERDALSAQQFDEITGKLKSSGKLSA